MGNRSQTEQKRSTFVGRSPAVQTERRREKRGSERQERMVEETKVRMGRREVRSQKGRPKERKEEREGGEKEKRKRKKVD